MRSGNKPSSSRALVAISIGALALRLAYAWSYQHAHTTQGLSTIPFLLEPGNIAAALATGQGFSNPLRIPNGPTAWMTPVYPMLLAGIFRLFGLYTLRTYEVAAMVNILFSTLTCVPIYLAAKRISGTGVAVWATALWAVFPNASIIPSQAMWDATLAAFLAAVILHSSLALATSQRVLLWIGFGLLWGIAIMTNAALILALPFLIGWLLYRTRTYHPLLAAGLALLCCVPWTARNYAVFHRWIPLRSVAGVSLWMGTIDPALGRWPGSYHPLADAGERLKFSEMGEIAYMDAKEKSAFAFMKDHPGTELHLIAERFLGFWAGGDLNPIRNFWTSRSLWFRWVVLFNLSAALAALFGAATIIFKRNSFAAPLLVFPVVVAAPYYLSLVSARYRLPVDPAVMVLAAIGLQQLWLSTTAGWSECRPRHYPI